MKTIKLSLVAATVVLQFPATVWSQDAAAPFRRISPSATPHAAATPAPKAAETAAPKPVEQPSPAPAESPSTAPAESPAPTPAEAGKPATKEEFEPVRAAKSRGRVPKEKPVRAVEPRQPLIRRVPAEPVAGPRAYRPTFDISESSWATAATLRSLENRWQAAVQNHDVEALDKLIADDFEGTSSTGREGSKSTLLAALRADKNVYKSARARGMSVRNLGPGTAVVTGVASETGTSKDGKSFKTSRRFTDTWKLRNGRWQCVASKVRHERAGN